MLSAVSGSVCKWMDQMELWFLNWLRHLSFLSFAHLISDFAYHDLQCFRMLERYFTPNSKIVIFVSMNYNMLLPRVVLSFSLPRSMSVMHRTAFTTRGSTNLAFSHDLHQHVMDSVSVLLKEAFTFILHLCRERDE